MLMDGWNNQTGRPIRSERTALEPSDWWVVVDHMGLPAQCRICKRDIKPGEHAVNVFYHGAPGLFCRECGVSQIGGYCPEIQQDVSRDRYA